MPLPWYRQSNRPKHIIAGLALWAVVALWAWLSSGLHPAPPAAVTGLMAAAVAALVKEATDRMWGGAFDWLDALATVIAPAAATAIALAIRLCCL